MDDHIIQQLLVKMVRSDSHQFPKRHDFQQVINDIALELFSSNLCIYKTVNELIALIKWHHKSLDDKAPNKST